MTANDIISIARDDLHDTVAVYRWTDAVLLAALSDGLQELYALRPDAFYVTEVVTASPSVVTALTDTVTVTGQFKRPLICYVASKALAQDSDDDANLARAKDLYAQFRSML